MPINFLEELAAQWYEHQGYFLRRNVKVGPLTSGGYEGELDIVALHPGEKRLIHLESSNDAMSWQDRERRFQKKFDLGQEHIPALFSGFELPPTVERVVLFSFASKRNKQTVAGARIVLIQELLRDILSDLRRRPVASQAVPEHLGFLRTLQFVAQYENYLF